MKSSVQYFLVICFAVYAATGFALGYIASYFLLKTVAYLSPWLPIWMWYGDIGLYLLAIAVAASSTVGIIAVLANKFHGLKLCSYILASLLLIEIFVTVQLTTRKSSLDDALYVDLIDSMNTSQGYYSFNISDTQMWDEIQLEVNCCGVYSYEDWFLTKFGNLTTVPDSCCLIVSSGCGVDISSKPDPKDDIIITGCLPTLMSGIREEFSYYGYTIWFPVAAIQSLLMMLIIYLVRQISLEPSYYPYILSPTLLQNDELPKYQPLQ